MRPTLPSPMSMPSYSCCARRMVRRALKPSLRAASCCSVEVVKGGAGLRRRCLRSIASTEDPAPCSVLPAAAWRVRSTSRAVVSLVKLNCSTLVPAIFDQLQRKALARNARPRRRSPVLLGLEGIDLGLAFADHAQRRTLHAPGRQPAPYLLPQQRRKIESDQVVERAARLLRVHQLRTLRAARPPRRGSRSS